MKFFLHSSDKTTQPPMLTEVTETDDGKLVAKLTSSEYKSQIEIYLNTLISELHLDGISKPSFTFEYQETSSSFIINPINVTAKDILAEFSAVKILPPEKENTFSPGHQ